MDFSIMLRTRTLTELGMRGFILPNSVLRSDDWDYTDGKQRLVRWLGGEGFTRVEIKPYRLPCCDYIYPNTFSEHEKHRQTATPHTEPSLRFSKELAVGSSEWQWGSLPNQVQQFRTIIGQFLHPYLDQTGSSKSWAGKDTPRLASELFDKIKVTFRTRSFIIGQSFRSFRVNPASGVCGGYDFALQTYNGHPTASLRWSEPRDLSVALEKFLSYLEDFCRACLVCSEAEMAAHRIMGGDWSLARGCLKDALKLIETEPVPQVPPQQVVA